MNKIICGDSRDILKTLPEQSIQTVITSPPYYGLRSYDLESTIWDGDPECDHQWESHHQPPRGGKNAQSNTPNTSANRTMQEMGELRGEGIDSMFCCKCDAWMGTLGLEPSAELYIRHLVQIFREVKRVLRDDGTLWLNIGDSYSVGTNFLNCLNPLMKGSPLVYSHAATIRISSESSNISVDDQRFPYRKFLSLFGIERVSIKQRNNDFCQVLHTLASPCNCWISSSVASLSRYMSDLEIVFDPVDDLSIIISNQESDVQSKFGIRAVGGIGSSISGDSSLSVEESAEPITKFARSRQAARDAFRLDSLAKSLPDVYLVNQPVSFADTADPMPRSFSNFSITKATPEHIHFRSSDGRANLAFASVTHLFISNAYGSFVRYNEVYDKAEQSASAKQAKQMVGIPDMLVSALKRDGWIHRSRIIWQKPNCMPSSVVDRPTTDFEHVFLLAKSGRPTFWTHRDFPGMRIQPAPDYRWYDNKDKVELENVPENWRDIMYRPTPEEYEAMLDAEQKSELELFHVKHCIDEKIEDIPEVPRYRKYNLWRGHDYYYDHEVIKEPMAEATRARDQYGFSVAFRGQSSGSPHEKRFQDGKPIEKPSFFNSNGRNKRSVWHVSTSPYKAAHFAVFPSALIRPMILAGSSDTACPACGAAWMRGIKSTGHTNKREPAHVPNNTPTKTDSTGWKPTTISTNRFVPTCDCPDNDGSRASIILDPFAGSGTTAQESILHGREYTAIEAQSDYIHMIAERVSKAKEKVELEKQQPTFI